MKFLVRLTPGRSGAGLIDHGVDLPVLSDSALTAPESWSARTATPQAAPAVRPHRLARSSSSVLDRECVTRLLITTSLHRQLAVTSETIPSDKATFVWNDETQVNDDARWFLSLDHNHYHAYKSSSSLPGFGGKGSISDHHAWPRPPFRHPGRKKKPLFWSQTAP